MAKYVYPDIDRKTLRINFKDYPRNVCLKSTFPDGRIIANDNKLEGR